MKKALLAFFVLFPALAVSAQLTDWIPEDFMGEWELQLLFEVNENIANEENVPDYTWFDTINISFNGDGTAEMMSSEGDAVSVQWFAGDFVLTITFPDDGDFQYVATYQYVAYDYETVIVAMYDMFAAPRVGIMKRLVMAY